MVVILPEFLLSSCLRSIHFTFSQSVSQKNINSITYNICPCLSYPPLLKKRNQNRDDHYKPVEWQSTSAARTKAIHSGRKRRIGESSWKCQEFFNWLEFKPSVNVQKCPLVFLCVKFPKCTNFAIFFLSAIYKKNRLLNYSTPYPKENNLK